MNIPKITASPQQLWKARDLVLERLFNHIFQSCLWDGHGSFGYADNILIPVSICDIPFSKQLFLSIKGGVTSKAKLPQYTLVINATDTTSAAPTKTVTLLPQNINKDSANTHAALRGQQIAWVMGQDPKYLFKLTRHLGDSKVTIEDLRPFPK